MNGPLLVPFLNLVYIDSRDVTVRSSYALVAMPPVIKHGQELSSWVA
jgi:hypothetical protein